MTSKWLAIAIFGIVLLSVALSEQNNRFRRYKDDEWIIEPQYVVNVDGTHGTPFGLTDNEEDARREEGALVADEFTDYTHPIARNVEGNILGIDSEYRTVPGESDPSSNEAIDKSQKLFPFHNENSGRPKVSPVEAPLKTVRTYAAISDQLRSQDPTDDVEHLALQESLRSGNYWDNVYLHEGLRSSPVVSSESDEEDQRPNPNQQLERAQLHVPVESRLYQLIKVLRQISTPLLYVTHQ